jgi:hypothetical protein
MATKKVTEKKVATLESIVKETPKPWEMTIPITQWQTMRLLMIQKRMGQTTNRSGFGLFRYWAYVRKIIKRSGIKTLGVRFSATIDAMTPALMIKEFRD